MRSTARQAALLATLCCAQRQFLVSNAGGGMRLKFLSVSYPSDLADEAERSRRAKSEIVRDTHILIEQGEATLIVLPPAR